MLYNFYAEESHWKQIMMPTLAMESAIMENLCLIQHNQNFIFKKVLGMVIPARHSESIQRQSIALVNYRAMARITDVYCEMRIDYDIS